MKNVKKWLIIAASSVVILALAVVAVFSWLSNSFETFQTNFYNASPNYKLSEIKDDIWGQGMFQRPNAPAEHEITFMGKAYSGEYQYSAYPGNTPDPVDLYENKEQGYSFHVSSYSRKITGVIFDTARSWYTEECLKEDVENPEAYAISQARETAGQFVNLDQYKQMPLYISPASEIIDGQAYTFDTYFVKFAKVIADIETMDYIRVCVTSKGTIRAVHFGEVGAFDDFEPEIMLKQKIDANLLKTAVQAVQSVENAQYRGHNIKSQVLTITPNGEFAIVSKLNITCYCPPQDDHRTQGGTAPLEVTTIITGN